MKKISILTMSIFLTCMWAIAQPQTAADQIRLEAEEQHAKLLESAESGDTVAQYQLGMMYYIGTTIPQDYKEAAKWFQMAAERGDIDAQFRYGCLLYYGRGVEQDFVQSHMWFNLAAAGDYQAAKAANEYREMVAEKMTPKEVSEAQELAKNWKPKVE